VIHQIIKRINTINERMGLYVSYGFIPLTAICIFEVVMRYIFNSPTIWAWDVEKQLFGLITVVGGGYTLLRGSHVSIDILINRFSRKNRIRVKLFTTCLLLATVLILIYETSTTAIGSVGILESSSTYWKHPIYPMKIIIAIGICLLFLQGVSLFLSTLVDYRSRHNH
jgi:TRAP-type mannitol/chloroaromatic compound transport system permease small subunit